jgi:butyryl-CoA dehydrogenase
MAPEFVSEQNLRFLLYEVFHADHLTDYPYFEEHNREVFDLILDTAMRMAKKRLRPIFREMDSNPPRLVNGVVHVSPEVRSFLKECGEGGWISANAGREVGGQQLPLTIVATAHFIWASANYSAAVYPGLTAGAAHLIESFGADYLKERFLPMMYSGEWQGTMALTEPQAGSSLADLTTRAFPTEESGIYKLKGQKIFISAGDHDGVENVVHLALARINGSPPGVKGVSLFVAPKNRYGPSDELVPNDIQVSAIYHKLGYRGAPITQLSIGENDDCYAYLVGEANQGLTYMFQMMNEARIQVGMGAAAIASAAYYASLEYARQRPQGRPITQKDPSVPPTPIIERPDVRRMLLFQRAVVEGSLSLVLQCSIYSDLIKVTTGEVKEKCELLLDLLTPVAKTFPSEQGVLSVSQGLQCLGGYGYCDEFPLEQLYRDARIHPIHEGTTGIQGLDLLGRKIVMKQGKAAQLFFEEVRNCANRANGDPELKEYGQRLMVAGEETQKVTMELVQLAIKGELELFLADATLYLEMLGYLVIAWQWLIQGLSAKEAMGSGDESDFYKGKLLTMKYFFHYELPKIKGLAARLVEADGLTLKADSKYFT